MKKEKKFLYKGWDAGCGLGDPEFKVTLKGVDAEEALKKYFLDEEDGHYETDEDLKIHLTKEAPGVWAVDVSSGESDEGYQGTIIELKEVKK